jgi:hypothetical protein
VYDEPTLDDFKWATSIFWSRGLGLPVPVMQQQQQQDGVPGSSGSSIRIETLEGLVPGLDFANHSQQVREKHAAWWLLLCRVLTVTQLAHSVANAVRQNCVAGKRPVWL